RHTWSAPVIGTSKTSSVDFNDKNWISVDTSPSSPYFGRVYLTWTEFRSATATGNGSEPIMVSVSKDGGLTFGAPKQLSPAGNNGTGNGRQGSSSTVGPDGSVYVAFEQGSNQVLTISRDGGQKWTRPAVIGPVADIHDPIPGANFRTDSFPTIAADPRARSTAVYATWSTRTAAGGRIVVATSTDRGATWSTPETVSGGEGYAFFQGLDVAPTGRVDLAWQSLTTADGTRFGVGNASISTWASSKPAGGPWSAPKTVSTTNSDPAVSAQNNLQRQFWGDYNTLTSDAEGAWFIVTDSRTGSGCPAVDAYQRFLVGSGAPLKGDMPDRIARREAGVNPALSDPAEKPAPLAIGVCPAHFGDTDIRVVRF
ncbi:MAG: glycoside hydrolase, partial [Acidimicrobiia bacterium]|nr:glycoside hydrolase [Acidimicrobiia bacterium]